MGNSEVKYRSRTGREISLQEHNRKLKQRLRAELRLLWSRYSIDKDYALFLARRESFLLKSNGTIGKRIGVAYQCNCCHKRFATKDVQVDHINPIGKTPEFTDFSAWGDWLAKLFVTYDRLQVLCKSCHDRKTAIDKKAS